MRPSRFIAGFAWAIFWSLIALKSGQEGSLPGLDLLDAPQQENLYLVPISYWIAMAFVVLAPIYSLWFPSRFSIRLGVVGQIPLIVAAYRIWWFPLYSFLIISPVILWINAAHTQWQILKGTYVTGASGDLEGTPWDEDRSHIRGSSMHKSD